MLTGIAALALLAGCASTEVTRASGDPTVSGPQHFRKVLVAFVSAVAGAARHMAFAHEIHHRHGRFGRDAVDFAPEKMVEHHVADDEDVLIGEAVEDLF